VASRELVAMVSTFAAVLAVIAGLAIHDHFIPRVWGKVLSDPTVSFYYGGEPYIVVKVGNLSSSALLAIYLLTPNGSVVSGVPMPLINPVPSYLSEDVAIPVGGINVFGPLVVEARWEDNGRSIVLDRIVINFTARPVFKLLDAAARNESGTYALIYARLLVNNRGELPLYLSSDTLRLVLGSRPCDVRIAGGKKVVDPGTATIIDIVAYLCTTKNPDAPLRIVVTGVPRNFVQLLSPSLRPFISR